MLAVEGCLSGLHRERWSQLHLSSPVISHVRSLPNGIPEKVRREALRKIGTKGSGGASIGDGKKRGWLRVVDVYNSPEFTMEQHASIQVFINSYRDFLGPGELAGHTSLGFLSCSVTIEKPNGT
jgi:hypothetical protein